MAMRWQFGHTSGVVSSPRMVLEALESRLVLSGDVAGDSVEVLGVFFVDPTLLVDDRDERDDYRVSQPSEGGTILSTTLPSPNSTALDLATDAAPLDVKRPGDGPWAMDESRLLGNSNSLEIVPPLQGPLPSQIYPAGQLQHSEEEQESLLSASDEQGSTKGNRGLPDLQVTELIAPASMRPGETATVRWTVTNVGQGVADGDGWHDYVVFSHDDVVEREDVYLTSRWTSEHAPLEPGQSYTYQRTVEIPSYVRGEGQVVVATDRWDRLVEVDESNNTRSQAASGPAPEDQGGSGDGSRSWTRDNYEFSDTDTAWFETGLAGFAEFGGTLESSASFDSELVFLTDSAGDPVTAGQLVDIDAILTDRFVDPISDYFDFDPSPTSDELVAALADLSDDFDSIGGGYIADEGVVRIDVEASFEVNAVLTPFDLGQQAEDLGLVIETIAAEVPVAATVGLDISIGIKFDGSSTAEDGFFISEGASGTAIAASLDVDTSDASFPLSVGFLGLEGTAGSIDLDLDLSVGLLNPDGDAEGCVTLAEYAGYAVDAVADISVETSSLSGTVPVVVADDLFTAPGSPQVEFSADLVNDAQVAVLLQDFEELSQFTQFSNYEVLGQLDVLASWMTSFSRSDVVAIDLPFVDGLSVGDSADLGAALQSRLTDALLTDGEAVFSNAQQLAEQFATILGVDISVINPVYNTSTDDLTYELDYSGETLDPFETEVVIPEIGAVSGFVVDTTDPGTQRASVQASVSNDMTFGLSMVPLGVDESLSDRTFLQDGTWTIDNTQTIHDVVADGFWGIVGIEAGGASGGGTATTQIGLQDTDGSTRISFARLVDRTGNPGDLIDPSGPFVTGDFSLVLDEIAVKPGLTIPTGTDPAIGIEIDDFGNPVYEVVDYGFGKLKDFSSLTFGMVTDTITTIVDYQKAVIYSLIDTTIDGTNLLLDTTKHVLDLQRETIGTLLEFVVPDSLQELEAALDESLGTAGDATVEYDSLASAVVISFDAGLSEIVSAPFAINLADIASNAGVAGFESFPTVSEVDDTGSVDLTAGVDLSVQTGIDLSEPSAPAGFIYDTSSLTAGVHASGTDLHFSAALGAVGLFVGDGSTDNGALSLDDGAGGAASFQAGLADDSAGDGRYYLPELNTDLIETSASGQAAIDLPLYFPTTADFIGDLTIDIGDFGDLLGTTTLSGPDLADLAGSIDLLSNVGSIVDTLDALLGYVQDAIDGEIYGVTLPVVGSGLGAVGNIIGEFRSDIRAALDTELSAGVLTPDALLTTLNDVLGGLGLLLVDAQEGSGSTSDRIEFTVTIGRDLVTASESIDFDVGLPALGLDITGDVSVDIGWSLDLTFGVDRDWGGYFDTSAADEMSITMWAGPAGGFAATGSLAFLKLSATDNGSYFGGETIDDDARFAIDLLDGGVSGAGEDSGILTFNEALGAADFGEVVAASLVANAHIDLVLELAADADGTFPSLCANLVIDWSFTDVLEGDEPTVSYDELCLNMGSYFTDLIGPFLDRISNVLEPLEPILDILTAPLPVISDLQGPTSLLDLFGSGTPGFVSVLNFVADLDSIVDGLSLGDDLVINLGSINFDIDLRDVGDLSGLSFDTDWWDDTGIDPWGQIDSGAGTEFGDKISDINATAETELFFPIIEGSGGSGIPEALLLLLGQDASLVEFSLPELSVEGSFEKSFPLPPPLSFLAVSLEGGLGARAQLAFGYDTAGVRAFADDGYSDASILADGFFVRDLEGSEFEVYGFLEAGFGLNIVILKGEVAGGIEATLGADLNDEDGDGKLRGADIVDLLNRGGLFCLFEFEGKVDGYLELEGRVGVCPVCSEGSYEIGRVTLWKDTFGGDCEDLLNGDPVLASQVGSTLYLNMGSRAGDRLYFNVVDGDESFLVSSGSGGGVVVEALGFTSAEFTGVTKIIADGGEGDDIIKLEDGLSVAVEFNGGDGDDVLYGSDAADIIDGGAGNDTIYGRGGSDADSGGEPGLIGGSGNDTIFGQGGDDIIDGGDGNDKLYGGVGADEISGGLGSDYIYGWVGPSNGTDTDSGDTLSGGDDADVIYGQGGDDTINGDGGDDTVYAGDGSDTVEGGAENDSLWGEAGDDIITGDDGDDFIDGAEGADFLRGMGGIDSISGGEGSDLIHGGDGNDSLVGGPGVDEIHGQADDDLIEGNEGGDFLYGGQGRDFIEAHGGDDYVEGGANPDTIWTHTGNDVIFGGGGNDVIYAGAGDDEIHGGNHRDTIYGSTGSDTIYGDDGPDQIRGQEAADRIYGGAGADTIYGDAGDDEIFGESERDTVYGGAGFDSLRGGTGDDVIYGQQDADLILGQADNDTLDGGDADDVLHGEDGNDTLRGGAGDDRMFGGNGDDTVQGEVGDDTLSGDDGNDVLDGGDGNDTLLGGFGANTLSGGAGDDSLTAGGDLGGTLDGGEGNDSIVGTDVGSQDPDWNDGVYYGDVIFGGAGDDIIRGLGGADYIDAGPGDDWVDGGMNGDFILGGPDQDFLYAGLSDADQVYGDAGDDVLYGSHVGHDLLDGGDGDDQLFAQAGDDILTGGLGDDSLDGGIGADSILGGDGDDTLYGGGGTDILRGEGGQDVIYGSDDAADDVNGGPGDDVIFGNGGNDELHGGSGNDTIDGGPGDDELFGELGSDILIGGTDHDTLWAFAPVGTDDRRPDSLYGDLGDDDQLLVDAGRDRLFGDRGNDLLHGEGENDQINPGLSSGDLIDFGEGRTTPETYTAPTPTPDPSLDSGSVTRFGQGNLPFGPEGRGRWSELAGSATGDGLSNSTAVDQSIATDPDGNVYVAWSDARNGNYEIYVAVRNPITGQWSSLADSAEFGGVSRTDSQSRRPSISILEQGGLQYPMVAWTEFDSAGAGGQTNVWFSFYDFTAGMWRGLAGSDAALGVSQTGLADHAQVVPYAMPISGDHVPVVSWLDTTTTGEAQVRVAQFDTLAGDWDGLASSEVTLGYSPQVAEYSLSGTYACDSLTVTWRDEGFGDIKLLWFGCNVWEELVDSVTGGYSGTDGVSNGTGNSSEPTSTTGPFVAYREDDGYTSQIFARRWVLDEPYTDPRLGHWEAAALGSDSGIGLSDSLDFAHHPVLADGVDGHITWLDESTARNGDAVAAIFAATWNPAGSGGFGSFDAEYPHDATSAGISPTGGQVLSVSIAGEGESEYIAWLEVSPSGRPNVYVRGDRSDPGNIYYVNDDIVDGDVFASAPGEPGNSGTSPDSPLPSIDAVIAAHALAMGSVILVDTGEYAEVVNILSSVVGVKIVGSPAGARMLGDTMVSGMADVTFDGFDFVGDVLSGGETLRVLNSTLSGSLRLTDGSDVLISNNTFDLTVVPGGEGLVLPSVTEAQISANRFVGDDAGDVGIVLASGSEFSMIRGNTLTGLGIGISVTGDSVGLISDNLIQDNTVGVQYQAGADLDDNTILGNDIGVRVETDDLTGLGLYGSGGTNTITGNDVGVELLAGRVARQHIWGNQIGVSGSAGVLGGDLAEDRNLIERNTIGVMYAGTVQYNHISHNTIGVDASSHQTITHNVIDGNSTAGVEINGAVDVRVVSNTVRTDSGSAVRIVGGSSEAEILNNILVAQQGTALSIADNSRAGLSSDYNNLHAETGADLVSWGRSYTDVLDWRIEGSFRGYGLHSLGATALDPFGATPRFDDPTQGRFGLLGQAAGRRGTNLPVDAGIPALDLGVDTSLNLLTNPGFEVDLSGWTVSSGASAGSGVLTAFEGETYLDAGSESMGFAEQTVDLSALAIEIDSLDLDLAFGARFRADPDNVPDDAAVGVTFRAGDSSVIGEVLLPVAIVDARWSLIGDRVQIPVMTRSVDLRLETNTTGPVNGGFFDSSFLYALPESIGPDIGASGWTSGDLDDVSAPPMHVAIRSPDLYTDWPSDETRTIRWDTYDNGDERQLRIDLYQETPLSGPEYLLTLTSATDDDGAFNWAPSDSGLTPGTLGLVLQISVADDGTGPLNFTTLDRSLESFAVPEDGEAYFVDDAENTDDEFTASATGDNRATGKAADSPKANPLAILASYELSPVSTLSVDTGSYEIGRTISMAGSGFLLQGPTDPSRVASISMPATLEPVVEIGGVTDGRLRDLTLSGGSIGVRVSGASAAVELERLTIGAGSSHGIEVIESSQITLFSELSVARRAGTGVSLNGAIIDDIRQLTLEDNTVGLHLISGSLGQIFDAVVSGGNIGMLLEIETTVLSSVFSGTQIGLRSTATDGTLVIRNSLFFDNAISGIELLGNGQDGTFGAELVNNTMHQMTGRGVDASDSQNITLRNNIIWSEGDAAVSIRADAQAGFTSDYNVLRATNGAVIGRWGATGLGLGSWRLRSGGDTYSLSADPRFADVPNGDYHLRSTAGRWDPGSGAFVIDAEHSPAIDRGDASDEFGNETADNGGYINLGAYGNTDQASRSPADYLLVMRPAGDELIRAPRVFTIEWRSGGAITGVDIAYSTTGYGGGFTDIALAETDDGSYAWDTDGLLTSRAYVIRLNDSGSTGATDVSDGLFTVRGDPGGGGSGSGTDPDSVSRI